MTPTSHRQRVGKFRTRFGLRPTLDDVRKALNERRCAEHGPDYRGWHESGDGLGWTAHVRMGIPVRDYAAAEPYVMLAPPEGQMVTASESSLLLRDPLGGPW